MSIEFDQGRERALTGVINVQVREIDHSYDADDADTIKSSVRNMEIDREDDANQDNKVVYTYRPPKRKILPTMILRRVGS